MPVTRRRYPDIVDNRTVIIGGGLHSLVVAATMFECGLGRPVVFEQHAQTGGMFEQLTNFKMNSANGASVESVISPGPTRIPSRSKSDDLNWIPNAAEQITTLSGMVEFPYSSDMARAVQRGLSAYAEVYTGVKVIFNGYGEVYTDDASVVQLGIARRIVFAGGLVPRGDMPEGRAIMSGYEYMRRPFRDLAGQKIALVGGGDTAAQCAEIMLGQGITMPTTALECLHWYGGERMPVTNQSWRRETAARWGGIGRALPDETASSLGGCVIRPYAVRGEVVPMGSVAMVNGQVYDRVVMATGFVPALCNVNTSHAVRIGGLTVGRCNNDYDQLGARVFKVGTAANITAQYQPFRSRFPQAKQAIFNLAPRTAALVAAWDK